jgi:aspartyl/asparaginyl-tRNA synthetase
MFGAIMRVRSVYRMHGSQLFSGERFCICEYAIITGSDAEGAVKCLKLRLYHLTEHQEPKTESKL